MDEDVITVLGADETKTLPIVEPLDRALHKSSPLGDEPPNRIMHRSAPAPIAAMADARREFVLNSARMNASLLTASARKRAPNTKLSAQILRLHGSPSSFRS